MTTILICTVGGSHQPIVSAIQEQQPDYVVFVCTDKDPATGRPGSVSQVQGKGNCIKAQQQDDSPSLPNIPAQAGLDAEQFKVCLTVSDDLDTIYLNCRQALQELLNLFPNAHIVADYTGGTKSMSAGLIMAALEYPDVELQLVTGGRSDLIKVRDGSQSSLSANIEQIRFDRLLSPYRQAWTRYAYSEAEAGLRQLRPPRQLYLRSQLMHFKDLSRAYAEWDNFNHRVALDLLRQYAPNLDGYGKQLLGAAMRLHDRQPEKRDAACLLDLYHNASRRAVQGRYDDAIARIYRLIEWTAQWILKTQCGIATSDVAENQIPEGLGLTRHRDGRWQAGLFNAWQLVKLKTQGEAKQFMQREEDNLLNHIKVRNQSILAHGFEPIAAPAWQTLSTWMERQFIPMLLAEVSLVGIKEMPPQLPSAYTGNVKRTDNSPE